MNYLAFLSSPCLCPASRFLTLSISHRPCTLRNLSLAIHIARSFSVNPFFKLVLLGAIRFPLDTERDRAHTRISDCFHVLTFVFLFANELFVRRICYRHGAGSLSALLLSLSQVLLEQLLRPLPNRTLSFLEILHLCCVLTQHFPQLQ